MPGLRKPISSFLSLHLADIHTTSNTEAKLQLPSFWINPTLLCRRLYSLYLDIQQLSAYLSASSYSASFNVFLLQRFLCFILHVREHVL